MSNVLLCRRHAFPLVDSSVADLPEKRPLKGMATRAACLVAVAWAVLFPTAAQAVSNVYTEEFPTDTANWKNAGYLDVNYSSSGGVDGSGDGYIWIESSFADLNVSQGTFVRGHDVFDASGDAFVGDWIDEGIVELSLYVRHNAPVPLNYFVRIATPGNFPAAGVVSFVPVPANTWTEVTFDVRPSSPQIVTFEGSDYETIFSNVGNLQFAVSVPEGYDESETIYTFDVDNVSIATPEPTAVALVFCGLLSVIGAAPRGNRD